jgi:hypothetical protein
MAYNLIKGNVEFSGPTQGTIEDMVDDHSDQTIGGTKTFSQMVTASAGLSASVFYGDGSNLEGVSGGPIDTYDNSGDNRILTSVDSTTIQGEANLTFDGTSLSVTGDVTASANVSASAFQGDGNSLTNIGPSSLNYGNGLRDLANNLELNLDTSSGLQVGVGGLKVHLSTLGTSSALNDADLFIADQSGNKKVTALQIYNYVDGKLIIPTVAGADGQIQFNDAGDLGASSNLAFNSSTNTLSTVTVSATNVSASSYVSSSTYYGSGQNLSGIHKIGFSTFTASFNVGPQQSIAAINTSGSIVTASLGSASDYDAAQPLTFKDIAGSASVNNIVIEPSGSETIDGSTNGIKIELDYGSVTISSDGVSSFYIIGTN